MAGNSVINDSDLSEIGSGIGPNDLEKIALRYLSIPHPTIETLKAGAGQDIEKFKFNTLKLWRNQNPGQNARRKLYDLLEKARTEEGLINIFCYNFLSQNTNSNKSGMDQSNSHFKLFFYI